MINFKRYPHVNDLLSYYAQDLGNQKVIKIIDTGVSNEHDAEVLSYFIWKMADKMSVDSNNSKIVLGSDNNSSMLPDVEYEITGYLEGEGYLYVWDRISDEENPMP
jgi:hypothetical protein